MEFRGPPWLLCNRASRIATVTPVSHLTRGGPSRFLNMTAEINPSLMKTTNPMDMSRGCHANLGCRAAGLTCDHSDTLDSSRQVMPQHTHSELSNSVKPRDRPMMATDACRSVVRRPTMGGSGALGSAGGDEVERYMASEAGGDLAAGPMRRHESCVGMSMDDGDVKAPRVERLR